MRLEAHAKINIGLLVGEKRADGFHDIKTIMALISLKDIIDAECVESDSFSVTIDGNDSYLASGVDLMEKSALLYQEETGLSFSLRLSIENIFLQWQDWVEDLRMPLRFLGFSIHFSETILEETDYCLFRPVLVRMSPFSSRAIMVHS